MGASLRDYEIKLNVEGSVKSSSVSMSIGIKDSSCGRETLGEEI